MFSKKYPYLAAWADYEGTLEVGNDYHTDCKLRLINQRGTVYEDYELEDMDTAYVNAESYLKNEFPNDFGYELDIG